MRERKKNGKQEKALCVQINVEVHSFYTHTDG
jgi:hypothetical protein